MRKISLCACLLVLVLLSVPFAAAVDEPQELEASIQAVTVQALPGEADLSVIAACVMFCGGCVCGLLTGSEVVRKWTL